MALILDTAQDSKARCGQTKVCTEIKELPADLKHVQAATKIQVHFPVLCLCRFLDII